MEIYSDNDWVGFHELNPGDVFSLVSKPNGPDNFYMKTKNVAEDGWVLANSVNLRDGHFLTILNISLVQPRPEIVLASRG